MYLKYYIKYILSNAQYTAKYLYFYKKIRERNYCKYAQNLNLYDKILGPGYQGGQLRTVFYYSTFSIDVKICLNFGMFKQLSNFS